MAKAFVVIFLALLALSQVSAQFSSLCVTSGQNATSVLGQGGSFTSTGTGNNLTSMNQPSSVIVDSSVSKVYVSQSSGNLILRFNSTQAVIAGTAELILFGNTTGTCSSATLQIPDQLDYYGSYVFVADTNNDRVLRLANASTVTATIASADIAFGQSSVNICTPATGSLVNELNGPSGVAITNNGTMFVSEVGPTNTLCHIKRFDNVHTQANSTIAVAATLANGTCGATVTSIHQVSNSVYHLFVDEVNGHLFAADYNSARVVLFKSAHLKSNGSGADTFFGQPFENNITIGSCPTVFNGPIGVFYDTDFQVLIVTDQLDGRVLFFNNPLSAANGTGPAQAAGVIGQPNNSTCNAAPPAANASNIIGPAGVFYESDFPGIFLIVADYSANRVLRYQCQNATFTSSISVSVSVNASANASVNASVAASVPASSVVVVASSVVANSSVVVASSSGAVVASSSGAVVASSSGAVVASSSGAVVASSSGPISSGFSQPASSGASSSGAIPSSSGVPPSLSASVAPSGTGSTSASQSNTPSNSAPNTPSNSVLTQSNTAIAPPPVNTASGAAAVCGNGVLEVGEECDPGSSVPRTKCCTRVCTNLGVGAVCGKATSKCTKRPKCGRSLTSRQLQCNPGQPKPVGKRCGRGGLFSRKTCKADGTCSKN